MQSQKGETGMGCGASAGLDLSAAALGMAALGVVGLGLLVMGCDSKSEAPAADTAAASAVKSAGTAAPKKAPESPFSVYAQGKELRLVGTFGTVAGLYVGGMLFPVDSNGAQQIEGSMRVGGPRNSVWSSYAERVMGSWPDRAFAVTKGGGADTINLWKPNEKRNTWFADVRGGSDRDPLLDADLYIEGGTLGMQSLGDFDWKFWFAHPLKAKIVTKPSPGSAPKGAKQCKVPLVPRRIESFATGEVFVLGFECAAFEQDKGTLAMQRWTTASRQGPVETLPAELGDMPKGDSLQGLAFEAFAPDAVYVGSLKGLAKFDGSAWKSVKAPSDKGVQAVAMTSDKALWALSGGKLFAQAAGGEAWKAVALPEGASAVTLGSSPGKEPWVLVEMGGKSMLLGPKAKVKAVELPTPEQVKSSDGLEPASSACQTLFVPLRMNVSEGQGFDEIKKPLDAAHKGLSYATAAFGSGKMFGAVPKDYAQGMAVVATAKKNDDKGVARLICHKTE